MSESDKCFTINYLACMKQCFDSFIYHNYKHLRDNNYIDEWLYILFNFFAKIWIFESFYEIVNFSWQYTTWY